MKGENRTPGTGGQFLSSRAQFISDLDERLVALRQGLNAAGSGAYRPDEVNAVKRRLHALASAARVLDFGTAADALSQAEAALVAAGSGPMTPVALERVTRIFDALPTLVLGGAVSLTQELDSELHRPLRPPFTLLLYGPSDLAEALTQPGPLHDADCHETRDPDQLLAVQQSLGPDAVLIDGDLCPNGDLVRRVVEASGPSPVPVVVVCSFADPRIPQSLLRAGAARVLPRPVEPWVLQRSLRQSCVASALPPTQASSFEKLQPEDLVVAIEQEARRALVDALPQSDRHKTIPFESGEAVLGAIWTALSQLRHLAQQANPTLEFAPGGPSGAQLIAPGASVASHPSRHPHAHDLTGRRVLVVHPEPSIRASLSESLQAEGAEVMEAGDVPSGLMTACTHWPDAVVCGPSQAHFEGLELAHAIEQDIALADVPVLVVTSPPPADGSGSGRILQTLHASLAGPSILEARLRSMRQVHGRLDGLTPRSLLQLTSRHQPDATLLLRSTSLRFELHLEQGRLAFVSLHRDGREVARGHDALGPLLGTRTGRYRIDGEAGSTPRQDSFTLQQFLGPTIERARRARHWLSPSMLDKVARVTLDPSVVAQYLTECPRPVRALLTRLTDGVAPRRLQARIETSAEATRLRTTLAELCRRGAVVALFDDEGVDRLSEPGQSEEAAIPLQAEESISGAGPRSSPFAAKTVPDGSEPPARLSLESDMDLSEAVLQAVAHSPKPEEAVAPPGAPETTPQGPLADELSPPEEREDEPAPGDSDASEAPESVESDVSSHVHAARSAWQKRDEDAVNPKDSTPTSSTAGANQGLAVPVAVVTACALTVMVVFHVALSQDSLGLGGASDPLTPPAGTLSTLPGDTARSGTVGTAQHSGGKRVLASTGKVVRFTQTTLPLPDEPVTPTGQGLLEVQAWQAVPLRIDGQFVGSHRQHIQPMPPGPHSVQLGDDPLSPTHHLTIVEGVRIRVVAESH